VLWHLLLETLVPGGVLAASAETLFPTMFSQLLLETMPPGGISAASSGNVGSPRCFGSFCWSKFFWKHRLQTALWQLLLETLVADGV
jgi:hypothetical protein